MIAPTRISFILGTSATIRKHPVGRGFEEVYKRERHKLKSAPYKRRAKTPLCYTKKGSTLFALPFEGINILFGGVLGELEGTFSKVPSNQPRPKTAS